MQADVRCDPHLEISLSVSSLSNLELFQNNYVNPTDFLVLSETLLHHDGLATLCDCTLWGILNRSCMKSRLRHEKPLSCQQSSAAKRACSRKFNASRP
jgi:hypothetical protein